jgi:hypothetical protein
LTKLPKIKVGDNFILSDPRNANDKFGITDKKLNN